MRRLWKLPRFLVDHLPSVANQGIEPPVAHTLRSAPEGMTLGLGGIEIGVEGNHHRVERDAASKVELDRLRQRLARVGDPQVGHGLRPGVAVVDVVGLKRAWLRREAHCQGQIAHLPPVLVGRDVGLAGLEHGMGEILVVGPSLADVQELGHRAGQVLCAASPGNARVLWAERYDSCGRAPRLRRWWPSPSRRGRQARPGVPSLPPCRTDDPRCARPAGSPG